MSPSCFQRWKDYCHYRSKGAVSKWHSSVCLSRLCFERDKMVKLNAHPEPVRRPVARMPDSEDMLLLKPTSTTDFTPPFDLIGDLHGCCDELESLLLALGYEPDERAGYRHPEGRRIVFLGDLVDRGPRILDTLRLVMAMVHGGTALCVLGNHDEKLLRSLRGNKVRVAHGLECTLAEIDALPSETQAAFKEELKDFLEVLPTYLILDEGRLVVAHGGMKESLQGLNNSEARHFALYGDNTGEHDENGYPIRRDWGAEYTGKAMVVYGHVVVQEARWVNGTIDLDTGCVFGGKLTALRYPEKDLVSIPAAKVYWASANIQV